jgi:histone H3/H4
VPVGPSHDVANARDVVGWNVLVKEVAHRVDEDLPRASPVQRLLKLLWHESQVEALLEGVSRHAAETLREHLCVAEFAARAHLRAAADGVPRRVRPLNRRAVAHRLLSTE